MRSAQVDVVEHRNEEQEERRREEDRQHPRIAFVYKVKGDRIVKVDFMKGLDEQGDGKAIAFEEIPHVFLPEARELSTYLFYLHPWSQQHIGIEVVIAPLVDPGQVQHRNRAKGNHHIKLQMAVVGDVFQHTCYLKQTAVSHAQALAQGRAFAEIALRRALREHQTVRLTEAGSRITRYEGEVKDV